ncbi:hypothetical protein SNE40_007861 [Patella caerulea]|uniref:Uncharacterized protein n=1 Tax=Patella caerulea TaxID=87958 RepID=A0AAN8Q2X9_PATCE
MFKLQSFNRLVVALKEPELKIKDKYELIQLTMCPKVTTKYCSTQCIYRNSENCGIKLLQQKMSSLKEKHGDLTVTWQKWESLSYQHDGKTKSKKDQVTKRDKVSHFLDELYCETQELSKHLFVANWQQDMFVKSRIELPKDTALFVFDFAENYSCLNQDKIQSAHWAIQQVTVHPVVAYYHCEHDDFTHIAQEAMVMISEDLVHDSHGVHHFEELAIIHPREKRGISIKNVVEFTDGCSTQYKSKAPLLTLVLLSMTLMFH